ncbi:DUF559 domain-containing protein [Tenacibaculum finnmarkense]|uniref:DUF559 domain-containing protein n=1 Tax=Tenacibaculum finnmarkense TaxID=2781243 RepID=UPI00187B88BA|nr:DUF559 domain-containing protein [Tenacibaculum finnmarkense]MBE7647341.1 DUF559 domain-containing protein [Tenacibaculum finnmarkense genomovar ulcerans]MCG8749346.1 DUF559 domain-containing protein [Tenacibaculum finnmarkense]MCG8754423.1 DUF559 domain-containing protein [Tenacibaculum finnmarkense]MCG8761304.1 DUF559 domain-containing protein [Tenacibaculum finnmarkense]MCG8783119.1 DUF559 domain-containing protein [Tenacibaculum finnmarkense]
MRRINLNHSEEIYPYIFLPEIIKNHINRGYEKPEKLIFLNLEKPIKSNSLKKPKNDFYFPNMMEFEPFKIKPEPIKIKMVLELQYDSINEELENNTFYIGKYPLPKKPLLYHLEKKEKINYKAGFQSIFDGLGILPISGFILYFIFAIFGPLFITYQERREMSVWPFLIYGSLTLYFLYVACGIFMKNGFFEKYIDVKKIILEESKRIELLDTYKAKIKLIIERYDNDYENKLKNFENNYKQGSNFAEIGILKNILLESNLSLIDNRNSKKGKSELFFLEYLIKKFDKNIFTDYSPNIGKNPFQPDFIVFDSDINLYIDIEIDEPYSFLEGITIHHNRTKDAERNRFFNKINWGVIRFTEKQVIQNPEECCSIISNVFESIKNRKDNIQHELQVENFWTHEEALIMKMKNYRNSY